MFGDKLRWLRTSNGYSMDELAELYNKRFDGRLNKSTLSRYENGLQDPMFTVVRNLAELFNISVDEMIDDNKYIKNSTSDYKPTGFYIEPRGNIGKTIHFIRILRHASTSEISNMTGISLTRIDEIETGHASVSDSEISLLANALSVTEFMLKNSFLPYDMADQYIQKLGKTLNYNEYQVLELYSKLDIEDKAEIRGEMRQMLKADKYSKANTSYARIAAKGQGTQDKPVTLEQNKAALEILSNMEKSKK